MKEFFRILSEMYEGVESDKIGEFKFCVSYSLTNTSFHYTIHGFGINDEPDFSNKAHELLGAKVEFNNFNKEIREEILAHIHNSLETIEKSYVEGEKEAKKDTLRVPIPKGHPILNMPEIKALTPNSDGSYNVPRYLLPKLLEGAVEAIRGLFN